MWEYFDPIVVRASFVDRFSHASWNQK